MFDEFLGFRTGNHLHTQIFFSLILVENGLRDGLNSNFTAAYAILYHPRAINFKRRSITAKLNDLLHITTADNLI